MKPEQHQPEGPKNKKNTKKTLQHQQKTNAEVTSEKKLPSKDNQTSEALRKEKLTNEDIKVNKDYPKLTNTKDEPEKALKPGKTYTPEITPSEKKDIKTKINTSPGNSKIIPL